MDLYTDEHLAAMFSEDPWFDRVMSDPEDIRAQNYDLVFVPSYKRRSLKEKIRLLPDTPWISMHGFCTGPEFHRGECAAQRLADALDLRLALPVLQRHSRQKLKLLQPTDTAAAACVKLALTLGGVDPRRSYRHWLPLLHKLGENLPLDITLLGSANALGAAREIERQWRGSLHNYVNKTDLAQCRQLMSEQRLVIACDGGLMHLAATTPVLLISLFTSSVDAAWRLPADRLASALKSESDDVNAIDPEANRRSRRANRGHPMKIRRLSGLSALCRLIPQLFHPSMPARAPFAP